MSRVNVCLGFRVLLYFLYLIASCYRAIIGLLWIIGFLMQGTVLNMFPCVFNVVRYNSIGIIVT